MKKAFAVPMALAFCLVFATQAARAARVGEPAPDFTATDTHGQVHKLSEYAGKYVVLEWIVPKDCSYSLKQYKTGNMQSLQREWTSKGVIWFSVDSSAPSEPGYVTAEEENAYLKQFNAAPTAVLLDPSGALGHLYDAKTTPDMYVINPQGILIYEGAIDDTPSNDPSDIKSSKNYVSAALNEAMAGKPVSVATTVPYGCSVKYSD